MLQRMDGPTSMRIGGANWTELSNKKDKTTWHWEGHMLGCMVGVRRGKQVLNMTSFLYTHEMLKSEDTL